MSQHSDPAPKNIPLRWRWLGVALRSEQLGTYERFLVSVLATEFFGETHATWHVGQETLARAMGCSVKTVQRAADALVESGWLAIRQKKLTGRAHSVHEYSAAIPERFSWNDPHEKWQTVISGDKKRAKQQANKDALENWVSGEYSPEELELYANFMRLPSDADRTTFFKSLPEPQQRSIKELHQKSREKLS